MAGSAKSAAVSSAKKSGSFLGLFGGGNSAKKTPKESKARKNARAHRNSKAKKTPKAPKSKKSGKRPHAKSSR